MKIEVNSLSFRYEKSKEAVHDASFSVEKGEIFGLVGRNGSGKSTVLGLLAGALKLQTGEIHFDFGVRDLAHADPRSSVGVVFQSNSLDQKLSCLQNLKLAAMLYRLKGAEAARRIAECLELAGLTSVAKNDVASLSGGMKRRLDLVRAILHEPEVLLLDEPTVGLDEASFRQMWQVMETLRTRRQLTVVVATHRPEEAERCARVAIFQDGKITTIDSPQNLRAQLERDVVVLKSLKTNEVSAHISELFSLPVVIDGEEILVQSKEGHLLIPKLVEAFPQGVLTSVSLRQASMADVFLKLTGSALS